MANLQLLYTVPALAADPSWSGELNDLPSQYSERSLGYNAIPI